MVCVQAGQVYMCWASVNLLFVLLEGAVHFHSAVHSTDLQKVTLLCQQPALEGGCSRLSRRSGYPCVLQASSPSGQPAGEET